MASVNQVARGPSKGQSQPAQRNANSSSDGEESDDRPRKKKKTGAAGKNKVDSMAEERQKWMKSLDQRSECMKSMDQRSVTCERQVDRLNIGDGDRVVQQLIKRGLEYTFSPIDGYNRNLVVEFYSNLVIISKNPVVMKTNVRGRDISVTSDVIANMIKFVRPNPEDIEYPHPSFQAKTPQEYIEICLSEPLTYRRDYKKIPVGQLKPDYRLANKIVHYNFRPNGWGKQLGIPEIEFLHVFLSDLVIDVADIICGVMCEFRQSSNKRSSMRYPHLITQLCYQENVRRLKTDFATSGEIGPITAASTSKSRAMSRQSTEASSSRHGLVQEHTAKGFRKRVMDVQEHTTKEHTAKGFRKRVMDVQEHTAKEHTAKGFRKRVMDVQEHTANGFRKRVMDVLNRILCRQDDIIKEQKELRGIMEKQFGIPLPDHKSSPELAEERRKREKGKAIATQEIEEESGSEASEEEDDEEEYGSEED